MRTGIVNVHISYESTTSSFTVNDLAEGKKLHDLTSMAYILFPRSDQFRHVYLD